MAITLLIPKADDEYRRFVTDIRDESHRRALRWSRVTRWTPIGVLAPVSALFGVAIATESELTAESWTIMASTVVVQVSFAALVHALVPAVRGTVPRLQRIDCDREPDLRSVRGGAETSIEFVNALAEPLLLYWINYAGERDARDRLGPGEAVGQFTYVGHPFVLTRADGGCVGIFRAEEGPARAVVDREA